MINFTVLVYVALTVIMALAQLIIAFHSPDPMNVLLDLRGWVIPLVSGIFLAYGITKGRSNGQ